MPESKCLKVIEHDNRLLGVVILALALHSWWRLSELYLTLYPFLYQRLLYTGVVALGTGILSSTYLTLSGSILIVLRQPYARYNSIFPNFLSVVSAFTIYGFSWLPEGEVLFTNMGLSVTLILLGNLIILISFAYLRRSFTVTPQIRDFVRRGPYSFVRHPMYVGNVLVLLGVALLVGTGAAFGLSLIASVLQMIRARVEESLFVEKCPEYRLYRRQVGFFMPRISRGRLLRFSLSCMVFIILAPGISAAKDVVAESRAELAKPQVVGRLCEGWKQKADSDQWLSVKEQEQYRWLVDPDSKSKINIMFDPIPACEPLNELVMDCQGIPEWEIDLALHTDTTVASIQSGLKSIKERKGCRSIVGLNAICDAFRILSKKKVRVSTEWSETISECLDSILRKGVGHFERPIM